VIAHHISSRCQPNWVGYGVDAIRRAVKKAPNSVLTTLRSLKEVSGGRFSDHDTSTCFISTTDRYSLFIPFTICYHKEVQVKLSYFSLRS